MEASQQEILSSDWSRVITWPEYRPLIGRERPQQEMFMPIIIIAMYFQNHKLACKH